MKKSKTLNKNKMVASFNHAVCPRSLVHFSIFNSIKVDKTFRVDINRPITGQLSGIYYSGDTCIEVRKKVAIKGLSLFLIIILFPVSILVVT